MLHCLVNVDISRHSQSFGGVPLKIAEQEWYISRQWAFLESQSGGFSITITFVSFNENLARMHGHMFLACNLKSALKNVSKSCQEP